MTKEELERAIYEIYKLIHPNTTPPAEEVSDGGILDMIFNIVEPIVERVDRKKATAKYVVERLLEFKKSPSRWEWQSVCDSKEEADARMAMFNEVLDENSRASGGQITMYRVRELS